jgi:hypothetical protein
MSGRSLDTYLDALKHHVRNMVASYLERSIFGNRQWRPGRLYVCPENIMHEVGHAWLVESLLTGHHRYQVRGSGIHDPLRLCLCWVKQRSQWHFRPCFLSKSGHRHRLCLEVVRGCSFFFPLLSLSLYTIIAQGTDTFRNEKATHQCACGQESNRHILPHASQ